MVLPACVVFKIRDQYLSPDGTYTGFQEAEEEVIGNEQEEELGYQWPA